MNILKIRHHINSLQRKHDLLDHRINHEFDHRKDQLKLNQMKKEKLHLKDEIDLLNQKIKQTFNETT
jgi:uncharacterized protein YdcH (DUF465 family)